MKTNIKILDKRAGIPEKARGNDCTDTGYDLRIIDVDEIIGDVIFFNTGIAIQSPKGFYWEIVPCSRISKQGLSVANSFAVIDEDYTGEIRIAIRVHHEHSGSGVKKNDQYVSGLLNFEGHRYRTLSSLANAIVAKKPILTQLVLRKRYESDFVLVDELKETERGDGGFGSTEGLTNASKRKEILTKE
jgi:dUTP pyrophosphatase